ncbi:hypothetical protein TeGR_g516, partial [Tetraparma gracilis]
VESCYHAPTVLTKEEVDAEYDNGWLIIKVLYFFASGLPTLSLLLGGLEFFEDAGLKWLHTATVVDVRDHGFGFFNFSVAVMIVFWFPEVIAKHTLQLDDDWVSSSIDFATFFCLWGDAFIAISSNSFNPMCWTHGWLFWWTMQYAFLMTDNEADASVRGYFECKDGEAVVPEGNMEGWYEEDGTPVEWTWPTLRTGIQGAYNEVKGLDSDGDMANELKCMNCTTPEGGFNNYGWYLFTDRDAEAALNSEPWAWAIWGALIYVNLMCMCTCLTIIGCKQASIPVMGQIRSDNPKATVWFAVDDNGKAGKHERNKHHRLSSTMVTIVLVLTYSPIGLAEMFYTAYSLATAKEDKEILSLFGVFAPAGQTGVVKHEKGKHKLSVLLDNLCEPIAVIGNMNIALSKELARTFDWKGELIPQEEKAEDNEI